MWSEGRTTNDFNSHITEANKLRAGEKVSVYPRDSPRNTDGHANPHAIVLHTTHGIGHTVVSARVLTTAPASRR